MLRNQVDNGPGQALLLGQPDALFDMGDQNQGAHPGLEFVVGVDPFLVFNKVVGADHLADVVIVASYPHEKPVCADGICGGFGEGRP